MERNMEEKDKKKSKKKILTICIIILILAFIGFFAVYKYISFINEEQAKKQKILEEKLNNCYTAIYDNSDFEEYKRILSTIGCTSFIASSIVDAKIASFGFNPSYVLPKYEL